MRDSSREASPLHDDVARPKVRQSIPARAGAIGKAFIAYLATGSLGVAVVVFIVAKMMGC